jgi:hypothetical protein
MAPNPTPAPVASPPPLLQWHPIPHQHLSHLTLLSYNGTQSHTSTCRISPGVRIDSKGGASKPYFGYPFVFDTEMFAGMEGGAIADGEHYAVTYYTLTHYTLTLHVTHYTPHTIRHTLHVTHYTSHTIRHTLHVTHYTSHTIRITPGQHTPPYAVMISLHYTYCIYPRSAHPAVRCHDKLTIHTIHTPGQHTPPYAVMISFFVLSVAGSKQKGGGGAGGGGAGGAVVPSRPAEGHGQKDTQHTQKDTQQQVLSKFCGHAVVIVPRTIRYSECSTIDALYCLGDSASYNQV